MKKNNNKEVKQEMKQEIKSPAKYFVEMVEYELEFYGLRSDYFENIIGSTNWIRLKEEKAKPTPGMLKKFCNEFDHNYETVKKIIYPNTDSKRLL